MLIKLLSMVTPEPQRNISVMHPTVNEASLMESAFPLKTK